MGEYWYILVLAIFLATFSEELDKAMKKWIPDNVKRAKLYQRILIGMAVLYSIIMFFITKDVFSLPVALFLSGFPVICVLAGMLYAYFRHKKS